jgi:spore coat polysaccharide biosynthesis protein SpsF
MKSVAIIQARMSSERLPGKVLKPLGGKPVLAHVIGRLRRAKLLDAVMVATSDGADDNPVAALAEAEKCPVYRGSLHDVVARFAGAAQAANTDVIVRVTADCPLICPEVVDAMLGLYRQSDGAKPCVVTNARMRTFPRGLDAEVFSRTALDAANREASEPHQREHVTPYLYEHPELFTILDYTQPRNAGQARWTLDTVEDYRMLSAFFALIADSERATLGELLAVWDAHPELHAINAGVVQKHYAAQVKS